MPETKFNYKKYPNLASYIDRIDAEEMNFRRFMVKIHKGKYYTEKAVINIDSTGDIDCRNLEYAPSKEEKAAIKTELTNVEWPKAKGARDTYKLKITKDENLFVFWDINRKEIIMCQQRIITDKGDKAYIPWTFFNDGKWRCMEPDGKLPFWKPKPTRDKVKVMIHEGAKAACFIDGLINDPRRRAERKAHPWADELSEYEHWGMIGGALVPHRADYAELYTENPAVEVVYVCDNDFPGKSALQLVSKYYGRALKGIVFDDEFKKSWDMADEMPEKKFKGKRWTGKSLSEYKKIATYATESVPTGDKGRPTTVLRPAFAQEWIHSIMPDVYIHIDKPNKILTLSEFDDAVQPFSGSKTTSQLVKSCNAIKSVDIKYIPGEPSGLYGNSFNTHCPGKIKEEEGNPAPFVEFMEHLFPIEHDRIEVMRWVATLIAHPEIKMTYALLMISEAQGVGKSTLGDRILKPILGFDNVSSPSETEVVEGKYTYWMAHKRLAVINEIYAGHSSAAYNKLKPMITDPTITVRKKYLADYDIDNWMHILACSNNFNALKLTGDDRRWLIPKIIEDKRTIAYWSKFNGWLNEEGGLGIIIYWAKEFLKTHNHVSQGEVAPWSSTKLVVIGESYSPGIQMVANILDVIKKSVDNCKEGQIPAFKRCVTMDTDFVGLINDNIPERQISYGDKQAAVRAAARVIGWHIGEEKTQFRDGTRGRLMCLDAKDAKLKPNEIFAEVIPTRIRRLGKSFLVIDGETSELNIKRDELDDPRTVEAIQSGKLKLKTGDVA